MINTSHWFKTATTYKPGLSVEEIKKKYSLKTVYKMASNENPLPPPESLLNVLREKLKTINRYPTYLRPAVKSASQYYQVEPDYVILGNGSSELIDKLMQIYGEPDTSILISKHSFPLYALCAQTHRLRVHKAKMEKNLKVSVKNILSILQKNQDIRLIFISNPNNPTGSYITHSELETLLSETENQKVLVILDEAYLEYIRAKDFPNGVSLLHKFPHLVLLRSMSKVMGIAGLRAGVMLARPSITEIMKKVICPFNINALALQAVSYCLSHSDFKQYISDSKHLVWKGLDYFYHEFEKMGLEFYPSQANFLLFSTGLSSVFSDLLEKGLILRPIKEPGLENFLRISVGLPSENEKAISFLQQIKIT